MKNRRTIATILGTRPEVIKLAPVIKELSRRAELFDPILITTAQHREMLDQLLSAFQLQPDFDLDLMQSNQALGEFASRSLSALSNLLGKLKPDVVLIQGDTTTMMTAALASFYQRIPVGHVEAGLRSFDRANPFPEEINRRIAGCLADFHFAPTERARRNLLAENIPDDRIFVTGNTVVDALNSISLGEVFDDEKLANIDFTGKRLLLVTAHRRESHGGPLKSICSAIKRLAESFSDVCVVYPVHLNPNVLSTVYEELGKIPRVHLVEPVSYIDLLRLMKRCYFILSDSGGIQEEAPSFHKPILVLREVTERPEVIEVNAGRLVGTDESRIVEAATKLLTDSPAYEAMSATANPFGDGHAAERIVQILADRL
jgi:UDP-N-acetylglucosamine 2-epimerase (non-hydrolysing)